MEFESIAARGLQVLVALGGAYLLALWFVLIVWTFRDVESRSRSVVTQVFSTLLVVLFWVPGLLLYWVLRPKQTLDDTYQRSLEEEYLLQDLEELPVCPKCQHFVQDDFRLCPHCQTELRDGCVQCERLIDLRWQLCPYCGADQDRREELVAIEPPAERWVAIEAPRQEPALVAEAEKSLPASTEAEEPVEQAAPRVERLDRLRFGRAIRPDGHRNGTTSGNGAKTTAPTDASSSMDNGSRQATPPVNGSEANGSAGDSQATEPATVPRRFKVES